jgi:hypothetical protein
MINDVEVPDIDLWKYVDDTTISETVLKHEASIIQSSVDEFSRKSTVNKLQLNEEKCKDLQITFATPATIFSMRITNDTILNGIPYFRDCEGSFNKILLPLSTMKRTKICTKYLLIFYLTCVRPVMEYAQLRTRISG